MKFLCKIPPWIIQVGDILYDCWQCIYESLFWFMYLLSCTWESHQQQKQRYFDDMMTFSAKDNKLHLPATTTAAATTLEYPTSISRPDIVSNISKNKSNGEDIRTFQYSKSYIKRILKTHLKSIRQKQRVINNMMKRSLLRRATKIALIQPPPPPMATAAVSMTRMAPMFIPVNQADGHGGGPRNYYPSLSPSKLHKSKNHISPLPPLKTLAHQGKLTPEIVSLSKSLILF